MFKIIYTYNFIERYPIIMMDNNMKATTVDMIGTPMVTTKLSCVLAPTCVNVLQSKQSSFFLLYLSTTFKYIIILITLDQHGT